MPVFVSLDPSPANESEMVAAIGSRHGDSEEDSTEGVLEAKIVAMLVLGVCTLFLGMLPMWLSRRFGWHAEGGGTSARSQMALSLLRALGGGALLATTFLHMIPETRESVEHLQEEAFLPQTAFHLPELLVCCGFFIMYTVEEVVHWYVHRRERKGAVSSTDDAAAVHRSLSIRRCSTASQGRPDGCPEGGNGDCEGTGISIVPSGPEDHKLYDHLTISRVDECARVHNMAVPDYGTLGGNVNEKNANEGMRVRIDAHGHSHAHGHGHSHLPPGIDDGGDNNGGVAAGLRGLLVVLALSVHELFEGLAVGLQVTAAHVYYLMGAVAAHKLVLAFCVGLELVAARTRARLAALYVLVFAAVSPVGIGVGIALSGDAGDAGDAEHSVANTVLQGLAAGTLLYVVFFEVLQRERASNAGVGLQLLLAVAFGFALMFGLLNLAGHEHNHGGGHTHSHPDEHSETGGHQHDHEGHDHTH